MMVHHTILRRRQEHRKPPPIDNETDTNLQAVFTNYPERTPTEQTPTEMEYMAAARSGDLEAVKRAIEGNVDVNYRDELSHSSLELALMGDHVTTVEYLLPRLNVICVDDALLYAIEDDHVKMCELILAQSTYINRRVRLAKSDVFYQKSNGSVRVTSHTTPIILAAVKNNFHVLKLLIKSGATINTPHDYFCECVECGNMKVFDAVRHSHTRLNTYRAMASPAYMSLVFEDPILTAFQLSHVLDKLTVMEKEYRNEYKKLSNQCKNYAVELLDFCRSTEEIAAILNGGDVSDDVDSTPSLTRVKLAIKYEQKQFIAHATCQQQLTNLWYSGVERIRHHSSMIMLLTMFLSFLLLPITSIIYLFAPTSKIGRKMQSPYVKFVTHTGLYFCFLSLVFIATSRQGSGSPWLDIACKGIVSSLPDSIVYIAILIFVIGMLFQESRQLWEDGLLHYVYNWWNWMDSTLIALYLAYYALQILVFYKVSTLQTDRKANLCPVKSLLVSCRSLTCTVDHELRNYTNCGNVERCADIDSIYTARSRGHAFDTLSDINQLSDVFFALASLLSFTRLAHLLPASEQLGPLLVSFGRMIHNVIQFSIIFVVVFVAFMCGLTSLYRVHQCENVHFTRLDQTVNSLFWATFGMGDTKAAVIDKRYLGSPKNLISTHSTHHRLTEFVGYGLFWAYITAVVLVMLNMLIAMMSNSFQEIYDDSDVEWKFARAKLWIDFFEPGFTLPPPFNLLPNPVYIVNARDWLRQHTSGCCQERDARVQMTDMTQSNRSQTSEESGIGDVGKCNEQYTRIVMTLIDRYIYTKDLELKDNKQSQRESTDMRRQLENLRGDVTQLLLHRTTTPLSQRPTVTPIPEEAPSSG